MGVKINKKLGDIMAAKNMMNKTLREVAIEIAPSGKTVDDFGGGYVEIIKTKANVVLYFGYDKGRNKVASKFEIEREEVALWLEAIAESLWNTGEITPKRKFSDMKSKFEVPDASRTNS